MRGLKLITFIAGFLYICSAQYALGKQPHITAKFTTVTNGANKQVYDNSLSASDFSYLEGHAPSTLATGEKYWINPSGNTWYDKWVKNRVVFYLNTDNVCINKPITAKVTLQLQVYNYHNGSTYTAQTSSVTLNINYDPVNVFSKKVVYELPTSGYKMLATVTSVQISDANYSAALNLETEFEAERYFAFNYATSTPANVAFKEDWLADKTEYQVTWDDMEWAEEYDLEWTFIDETSTLFARDPGGAIDEGATELTEHYLKTNSTRITTKDKFYNIPAIYGNGVLIYRVRGYGKSADDQFTEKIPGPWSTEVDGHIALSDITYHIISLHAGQINWQSSVVFAEEGKNKVSLKYFDGSMRSRQEITKMNSGILLWDEDKVSYIRNVRNTVVSETIYDHQGRPAINTLPAPTEYEKLTYYELFNKDKEGTSIPYTRINFDLDDGNPCVNSPQEMSNVSGAANYYSSENVFLTSLAPPQINKTAQFIPDAGQYPFVQTTYTPDNTGRILAKSGAGIDHRIGSGHETKYFYTIPFQEELDRLLGAEAGFAEHYKKNIVIDANGQQSISYLDINDKVVATALVGPKPASMVKTDTYKTGNENVAVDLLNKVLPEDHLGKSEVFTSSGKSRYIIRPFYVADEEQRLFDYQLKNESYQYECEGSEQHFCYECVLDLKIRVRNECGVDYLNGIGEGNTYNRTIDRNNVLGLPPGTNIIDNCGEEQDILDQKGWESNIDGTAHVMEPGKYTLSKVLTVNQVALDKYTADFLKNNECLQEAKQAFINDEKSKMDTSMCTFDCTEWLDKIGATWATSPLNNPNSGVTEEAYNKLYKFYLSECNGENRQCKAAYEMLLQDVSPMGQYGEIYAKPAKIDANGKVTTPQFSSFAPGTHSLSVFNETNYLPWKKYLRDVDPGYWPSWRFPYNYWETDPVKRVNYLNEDGNIVYIYLERNEKGGYTPDVNEANYSYISLSDDGKPRIPLKYLANLKDVIDRWEPVWAKSIVIHHPEFYFYVDCISRTQSNTFDNEWLEIQSLTDVNTKYYTGGVQRWKNPLGTSINSTDIIDPFFDYRVNLDFADQTVDPSVPNATGAFYYNTVKNKLTNFVKRSNGSYLSMKQVALVVANCPSLDVTNCSDALLDNCLLAHLDITTDEEWRVYRQLYFSVKQKAVEAWSTQKSIYNPTGGDNFSYYNGCIGQEVFDKFRYNFFKAYYNNNSRVYPWFHVVHMLPGFTSMVSQYFNPEQPCNWARYWLYKNKEIRYRQSETAFPINAAKKSNTNYPLPDNEFFTFGDNASDLAIIDEAKKIVDPESYKANCGQCPVADNMVNLLNKLITNSKLITNGEVVRGNCGDGGYAEMTPELVARVFPLLVTSGIVYKGTKNTLDGHNNLDVVIGDNKNIRFRFPASSVYDADDIVRFCCIRGNTTTSERGAYNFKITAFVKVKASDTEYGVESDMLAALAAAGRPMLREITLDGLTTEVDLVNCDNTPLCRPSKVAAHMLDFLNAIISAPFYSTTNLQASVWRDDYSRMIVSAPHQLTFTDEMAKRLFPGKFKAYKGDVYKWTAAVTSTTTTEQVLTGAFSFGTQPVVSIVFKLFRPTGAAIEQFENITSFNSITPKLGQPHIAIIKATVCTGGVCKLITIEADLAHLEAGNCSVGLPKGMGNGRSAENNEVKPDILGAFDYNVTTPEYAEDGHAISPVTTLPENPCLNIQNLRDYLVGQFNQNDVNYDPSRWITEWEPCPTGHGWYAHSYPPNLPDPPSLVCGDCGVNFIFPQTTGYLDSQGNPFVYKMQNIIALNELRQVSKHSFEMDATTFDGKKITVRIEFNEGCVGPAFGEIYDGAGDYPEDDEYAEEECQPEDVLGFPNFYTSAPAYDEMFQSDFVAEDLSAPGSTLIQGEYTIQQVVGADKNMHYGSRTRQWAMHYVPNYGTWQKVWESADVLIEKGIEHTFTFWHKEVGRSPGANAIRLNISFNGIQPSVMRTRYSDGTTEWYRYDVVFLLQESVTSKLKIESYTTSVVEGLLFDIRLLKNCRPTVCCPLPMPEIPIVNPCHEQLLSIAMENAEIRYQQYLEPIVTEFQQGYIQKCLNVYESFTMRYSDSEDHTTLYYYDQAGNLVRTVPPKGVVKITDADKMARIREDRAKGMRREFTDHEFKTTYTYNSLNQLISQSTPDQVNMPVWNTELKNNGIPANYVVKDVKFTDKLNGVLVANYTGIGHIFKTSDGGDSWTEINAFGLTNLNSIKEDDYQGAYTVGDKGLFMQYIAQSSEWVIRVLPTAEKLVKVNLIGSTVDYPSAGGAVYDTRLWIHDEKGQGWIVNTHIVLSVSLTILENEWDFEGPYTGLSDIITDKVSDVVFQKTTSSSTLSELIGYAVTEDGKIYRTEDHGVTWTLDKGTLSLFEDLTSMHFTANNEGYIGGVNGLLLKGALTAGTVDLPAKWRIIPTNISATITKVHFMDAMNGFVLGNDFNFYRTTDGGYTFKEISISGDVVDFTFGNNSTKGYLVTKSGHVHQTIDGGKTWLLYSQVNHSGTAVYTAGATEAKKIRCYINTTGSSSYLMVTGNSSVDYCVISATPVWTALSVSSLSPNTITDTYLGKSGSDIRGTFLLSNGDIKTNNIGTSALDAMYNAGAGGNAEKLFFTENNKAIWCSNNMVKIHASGTTWNNRVSTGVAINAFALTADFRNIIIAGNGVRIQAYEGIQPSTSTPFVDLGANIILPKLNAVHMYNTGGAVIGMAAGKAGLFLVGVKQLSSPFNASWLIRKLPTSSDLNDVFVYANAFTIAGNNGIGFSMGLYTSAFPSSITIPATTTNFYTTTGLDIVAGAKGEVFHVNGTQYTTPVTSNKIYSGSYAFVVGQNGYIGRLSGSYAYQAMNPVVPPVLNALHFVTASTGYAGGEQGSVWKTTDGGNTWSNVTITGATAYNVNDLFFTDANTGYIVTTGNRVYKTVNGGASYTIVNTGISGSNALNAIDINSNGLGYIVGDNGACAKTTDYGNSWSSYALTDGTKDYTGVTVPDYNLAYACAESGRIITINPGGDVAHSLSPSVTNDFNDIWFTDRKTGYVVGSDGVMLKTVDGGTVWQTESSGLSTDIHAITPADEGTLYLGGVANKVARISDQKDRQSTRFFYDALGRLVISQNTKQYNKTPGDHLYYSYTLYDYKGRIIEVGEAHATEKADNLYNSYGVLDDAKFQDWILASERKEVTRTFYDVPEFTHLPVTFQQKNLRNRVASAAYYATYTTNSQAYESATHYTYDIHGNVNSLLQDNTALIDLNQNFKRIDYTYDLISGKVLEVAYQHGNPDRFYHRYNYDADNRVTSVETSYDNVVWEKDAKYLYYLHGPLARTELGNDQVQGLDYAYTIQGWLKAVNGGSLDIEAQNTMGSDGVMGVNNQNSYFGKDEIAYELNYYGGDYQPVAPSALTAMASVTGTAYQSSLDTKNLFNGNISGMITSHRHLMQQGQKPLATAYAYDQLNRIKEAAYFTTTPSENWAGTSAYLNQFEYDANGNITRQWRNGEATNVYQDELDYKYYTGTNRLKYVTDEAPARAYSDDIDDQLKGNNAETYFNYTYDELGNLTSDIAEEIDKIEWNLSGKITKIIRTTASLKPDLEYRYDPAGNRITKIVTSKTGEKLKKYTFYVRDAQGNIMTTYTRYFDKDVNYNNVTFAEVNNILMDIASVVSFNQMITQLHIPNNNSNTAFFSALATAAGSDNSLIAANSMYFGNMIYEIGGLFNDAYMQLSGGQVLNLYANNMDATGLQALIQEICGCYQTDHDNDPAKPGFVQYFFNEVIPGVGNQSPREVFLTYLYEYNSSLFYDFVHEITTPSYDFEIDLDFLLNVSNEVEWEKPFNNLDINCEMMSEIIAYGYQNSIYGGDLQLAFANLPELHEKLNPAMGTCTLSYPDQYSVAQMLVQDPAVISYLIDGNEYDPELMAWLLNTQTYSTINQIISTNHSYISTAQQAVPGIYGGMENYFAKIDQYYGTEIYKKVKNMMSNAHPAYVDKFVQNENNIYGSSRVGTYQAGNALSQVKFTATLTNGEFSNIAVQNVSNMSTPSGTYTVTRGNKRYELSNHLGNVLAVISDKKLSECSYVIKYAQTFDGAITGSWNNSYRSSFVVDGSEQLNVNGLSGTSQIISPAISFTAGKKYQLSFDLKNMKEGNFLILYPPFSSAMWLGLNTHYNFTFTAAGSSASITMNFANYTSTTPVTYSIDNVEIRELPGTVESYTAEVLQVSDYSPFGAPLAGRTYDKEKEASRKIITENKFNGSKENWVSLSTATVVHDAGRLKTTVTAGGGAARKQLELIVGNTYKVRFRIDMGTSTNVVIPIYNSTISSGMYMFASGIPNIITQSGVYEGYFTAQWSTSNWLFEGTNSNTFPAHFWVDDFVVEEDVRGEDAYAFGFNGMEADNELYGDGNAYTAEFWQYDARLGRRFNIDPVVKPWESSYATFSNNPVYYIDPSGDDPSAPGEGDKERFYPTPDGRAPGSVAPVYPTPDGKRPGSVWEELGEGLFGTDLKEVEVTAPKPITDAPMYTATNLPPKPSGVESSDADNLSNFALGFTIAGIPLDIYTAWNGKEYGTNGQKVSGIWRYAGIIPFVSEFRKAGGVLKHGDEIVDVTKRVGRDGDAVEVTFKSGSKMDINGARVKEWVPQLHPGAPPGTLQKVKFESSLPGSKGYKRVPTAEEIEFLKNVFKQ